MVDLRLPDFVIIGATKSATTWLTTNLRAHPEVFMPSPELHYFSRWFDRGDDWYRAQLAGAGADQLLGEKSASYLPHPEAPQRLHRLLPRAKLLVQLRNPVERAYSDYCMHYRRGEVTRDVGRYLDARHTPISRLLEDGFYHRHLMRFMDVFPAAQIKILLYDDIRERPGEVFREVCGHLGIDDTIAPQTVARRVKDKETPVVPPRARRLLAPLKAIVQPYRQTRAFVTVRSLIARRLRYPPLTPELRQRLEAHYADDVARLGELLGRDLSIWRSGGADGAAAAAAAAPTRSERGRPIWASR
ncbi:MAG: sulfotransferase family protein [Geminicoccaceae bacterium]